MTRTLACFSIAALLVVGGCGPGDPGPEICDNGIDDDGNGLVDCDDVAVCSSETVTSCAFEPPACRAEMRDEIPEVFAEAVRQNFLLDTVDVAVRDRIEVPGDRDCFSLRVAAGSHYLFATTH
ncbi:MAG: hypothetical protein AAF602_06930, partial [Myxococcota bacterium]